MTDLMTHIKTLNDQTRAWVAAAPGRFAGTWTEDMDHWAEMGVYTVDQFERYVLIEEIWDSYKEAYGVRPRHMDLNSMTMDELVDEARSLREAADEAFERERELEALAIEAFEDLLRDTIALGAANRVDAIRWLREARDGQEASDDSMEWEFGLPMGYLAKVAA